MAANDFRLLGFIAADLRRAYSLRHGDAVMPGRLRLVVGFFSPRFAPVFLCRLGHWFYIHRLSVFAKMITLANFLLFGLEVAPKCPIGKGLYFPHTHGLVIGAESIGENAILYHNVTLGARDLDIAYLDGRRPVLGNDVLVGTGAVVIGGISIGDGVRIGANAVVFSSIPAGALVRAPKGEIIERVGDDADI
jgi:serine O-acetyltransferase